MTDPTMQTSGGMLVVLKNLTNLTSVYSNPASSTGLPVQPNPPTYTPLNQPPPAWTQGKQYRVWNQPAYTYGSLIPIDYNLSTAAGVAQAVKIMDMSSQTVVTNKQYQFTVDTPISGPPSVRLFWNISGVSGGSTVMPGFGLYNLVTAPGAWTYLTPPTFTGNWSIELANPQYAEPVTLSVSYISLSYVSDYGNVSRLAFTIAGGGVTYIPNLQSEQPGEQWSPEHTDDSHPQEILSPTSSYQLVRELQAV
jgi:hypothetical protein